MRDGLVILAEKCRHCAHMRTVPIGNSANTFCFNCREASTNTTNTMRPPVAFLFDARALARLEQYRAAVRAGFYSDWGRSQAPCCN
jgi:hypothetical protein